MRKNNFASPKIAGADGTEGGEATDDQFINSLVTDVDPHEERNRRRAFVRHITRFTRQAITIACLLVFVSIAPEMHRKIVVDFASHPAGLSEGTTWHDQISYWKSASLPFAIPAAQMILVIGLLWYLREQSRYWRLKSAQSHQREPEICALGYMGVFRIYARTNRTAIFVKSFALATVYSALIALYIALRRGGPNVGIWPWFVIAGIPLIEILMAAVLLKLSFEIGRRFVPGLVLSKATIMLAILAATSQTDYAAAEERAARIVVNYRDDRPWWFYVFRAKRKRGFKLEGGWTDRA